MHSILSFEAGRCNVLIPHCLSKPVDAGRQLSVRAGSSVVNAQKNCHERDRSTRRPLSEMKSARNLIFDLHLTLSPSPGLSLDLGTAEPLLWPLNITGHPL